MDIGALLATTISLGFVDLSVGDVLGFATGLLCVWFTAKASVWNFPWGILNSLILSIVFLDQRLYADSVLQIVFILLSARGWWQWSARSDRPSTAFQNTTVREQTRLLGISAVLALLLWGALVELRGSSPPMDALITAMSLCAQWQLNRRQVSSWYWWIAVDLISVPLYWSRGLYLIAGLYVVFLGLCIHGLRNWQQAQRVASREALA